MVIRMKETSKMRLGDLLVTRGIISNDDLLEVLAKQKTTGKRLGEILIDEKYVCEEDILNVLEIQLGIERVILNSTKVDKEAVYSIPENLARRYNLIPISIVDNIIKVVMNDPLNIIAIDDVEIATGYEVEPIIATKAEIIDHIERYYTSVSAQNAAKEFADNARREAVTELDTDSLIDDVKTAPAVRVVDSIIKAAIKNRASDIHIEPFDDYMKVRFRIDGELVENMRTTIDVSAAVITRIKIMGNMNIAEKRVPQDGRVLISDESGEIDLRVSSIPTLYGEKIVIRILLRDGFAKTKGELGMAADDLKKIERLSMNSDGIILVSGPTGSGKSTTLYAMLTEMNTPNKNLVTVEDPVEYMIEGANQVNVNAKSGMTFASGLRSILRQDPDIIMVGEIRDGETAEIAIRAAITGHIVLSTIHTNDAASTVVRLTDMDIEPFLVASSLVGVIAQRLVRRVCTNCKEEYEAGAEELSVLGLHHEEKRILYKGRGCPVCNGTGYYGRVGIYEIMEITKEHKEAIVVGKTADELKSISMKNGMKTLRMSCVQAVLEGKTTVNELIRVAFLKE